jgi:hypothetical protein
LSNHFFLRAGLGPRRWCEFFNLGNLGRRQACEQILEIIKRIDPVPSVPSSMAGEAKRVLGELK